MSVPYPSGAVVAPEGTRFAWVEDHRGIQNIWIYDAGDEHGPYAVTSYEVDDGQNLSDPQWLPDGSGLVYVRGQGTNAWSERENPTSDPAGTERAVWFVNVGEGRPQRLGAGHSPHVAPGGERVLFHRDGEVSVVDLAPDAKPERFFWARGNISSARWAPDSERVAFVRNRVGAGYALVVAEAETGKSEEIWCGSSRAFPRMASSFRLFWARGNRLVFPSEKDGWQHLWAVDASEAPGPRDESRTIKSVKHSQKAIPDDAVQLTRGECEVEDAAVSPQGTHLVASTNCTDLDRRQLHQVDPVSATMTLISDGAIDWGMAVAEDGTVLLQRGDWRIPPLPHLGDVMGSATAETFEPPRRPEGRASRSTGISSPQPTSFRRWMKWTPIGSVYGAARTGVTWLSSGWAKAPRSSPVAYVENQQGPVLLIAADDDRSVRFLQTIELVERLRRADKNYELLEFPDEVHGFRLHKSWERSYRAASDFLDRQL